MPAGNSMAGNHQEAHSREASGDRGKATRRRDRFLREQESQRAAGAAGLIGIAKTNRSPSRLTFFHCIGFPGSGPCSLNNSLGSPAWNVGAVLMSTAMT